MTILFTTEQFYPLQTGTAIADYNLCLALSRFGHVVYVITSSMFNFSRLTRKGPIRLISSGGLSKEAVEISPNLFVIDFFIVYEEDNWRGQLEDYQKFLISFECDLLVNIALRTWSTDYILDKFPLVKAKKKILRSHEEWSIMDNIVSWKRFIKDALKALLTLHIIHRDSHPWWQQYRFKKSLKYYDCVYFLHKGSHGYDYLKPYCTADILPNGVFEKDICPPKTIASALTEQQNNRTTEQQNNRTTEQQNNRTTEQQNNLADLLLKPYLLNVSNYYKEKGQDFVLKSYYLSLAKIPLVFVGSLNRWDCLDYLKELKRQLDQKHGFKEVYFFYKIERSQVLALFQQATLFLHGSRAPYDNFPMVILESMQFGIPFICTDIGNVKELCAELIVHTPEQMAKKINALLGNPDYYNKVARDLNQTLQEYTYEKIIKKLEALVG